MSDSLGEALPREIERVTGLIPHYAAIGPGGAFAIAMMRASLSAATRAIMEGDLPAMIAAYQDLKDFKD